MTLTHNLAQLQKDRIVLELECIDRMHLNAHVPQFTSEAGIAAFCRGYLGHRFASAQHAVAMTEAFIKSIRAFLDRQQVDLVRFQKGQRKNDIMKRYLRRFKKPEGVLFVGVTQEKMRVPLATRKARTVPLDPVFHRPGQRLLLLLSGPGFQPLLPQVRLPFSLPGQALSPGERDTVE